MARQTG